MTSRGLGQIAFGLRLKLACILFGCALLALGSATAIATFFGERALRSELTDRLERAVGSELSGVERYLDRSLDDLATIAENRVMQDVLIADDMGEIAASLAAYQSRYREFSAMFVTDDAGSVIASHGIDLPSDLSPILPSLQDSLAGHPGISRFGAYAGLAGEAPLLSVPIRADYDPDTIIGVVFSVLDVDRLRDQLSIVQVADQAQDGTRVLVLMADDGRVLYRTDAPEGEVLAAQIAHASAPSRDGPALAQAEADGAYLLSSAVLAPGTRFAQLGLQLHSAVSERVAFRSVERLKRNLVATSLMMALTMLPLGWLGARALTGPLGAMVVATTQIANRSRSLDGPVALDYGVRDLIPSSVLARGDEIGLLGRSFSTLMDQLSEARSRLIEQSQLQIAERSKQRDAALENMSQGLCMFDADGRLVVYNRRFLAMYGLEDEAVAPGMHIRDLLLACRAAGNDVASRSSDGEGVDEGQVQVVRPAVHLDTTAAGRLVSVSRVPMASGGWVSTFDDITDRRLAEARIEHLAMHDALTGLPNRNKFRQQLEQALTGLPEGERLAVLCLDLDNFKSVNDALGHPVGDELLMVVAERLGTCLDAGDLVARLGGDEFAVILPRVALIEQVRDVAQRMIAALSQPYELLGHQVIAGTSIGIAIGPSDGGSPDALVKAADLALYRAKADGRGVCRFFEPEMDERMQARRALELDLRKALAQGEFEVHYQPIVSLQSSRVSCFEALLRWHHPVRGAVPPGDFIPLAEEIGLIGQIGAWVLAQACQAAVHWPNDIRVAVNLSPLQFRSQAVVLDVETALDRSGLASERLELEITETVLLLHTDLAFSTLERLRALGVRIAMDDFGTGYSSLSYLRTFPFDKIKIDRSFIKDLANKGQALAIVRAISGLGASLGMTTTAEGVETFEQLDRLRGEGCTEVQGYYYSPAVRAGEVVPLVRRIEQGGRPGAGLASALGSPPVAAA